MLTTDTLQAVASAQSQQPASHEVILVVDHDPELQARLAERLPDVRVVTDDNGRRPVCGLAYPYEYSIKRVREVAREIGYLQAAAVANATAATTCDPFSVLRLTIRRSTSSATFAPRCESRADPASLRPRSRAHCGMGGGAANAVRAANSPDYLCQSNTGIEGVQ